MLFQIIRLPQNWCGPGWLCAGVHAQAMFNRYWSNLPDRQYPAAYASSGTKSRCLDRLYRFVGSHGHLRMLKPRPNAATNRLGTCETPRFSIY